MPTTGATRAHVIQRRRSSACRDRSTAIPARASTPTTTHRKKTARPSACSRSGPRGTSRVRPPRSPLSSRTQTWVRVSFTTAPPTARYASRAAAGPRSPRDPTTTTAPSHVSQAGTPVASTARAQRSVLPRGPPLRRAAPAPAAASDAAVGSVAATAASSVHTTGPEVHDPDVRAARATSPAYMSRSLVRSPISLRTKPQGRETPGPGRPRRRGWPRPAGRPGAGRRGATSPARSRPRRARRPGPRRP